jgi:PAS domain S-box-containing protein
VLSCFEFHEFTEALAFRRRGMQADARRLRECVVAERGSPRHEEATSSLIDDILRELAAAEERLRVQNDELFAARFDFDKSAHHFRRLFDFAPLGYLVTDTDGRILQINVVAADLLGHAVHATVGRDFASYVHPGDRRAFGLALDRSLRSEGVEEWPVRLGSVLGPVRECRVSTRVTGSTSTAASMYWMLRDDSGRHSADLL